MIHTLKFLGWDCGWRTIQGFLPQIPTRLIQKMLSQLKLEYRRRKRRHREKLRVRVVVLAKGALLGQDSAFTGRVRGRGASVEVTKDAATLKARAFGTGRPATAKDVLREFKRLKKVGRLPLAWGTDNASIFTAGTVQCFLRRNKVVHLRSRPRTPEDNGRTEQAIGEGRAESGLDRKRRLRSEKWGVTLFRRAFTKINRRPRGSKNWLSANELEKVLPRWQSMVSRRRFYGAVQKAVEKAKRRLKGRATRTAERKAIFRVMARFKLAKVKS